MQRDNSQNQTWPHPQTKVEGTEYQVNLPNNPGLPSSQINTRMKTTKLPHRRMDIWFCFQQWSRTVGTGERAVGQISSEASSFSHSHPFLRNVVALKKQWGELASVWMQQLCSEGEGVCWRVGRMPTTLPGHIGLQRLKNGKVFS